MRGQRCLYCGGDSSEPGHRCDGKQGKVEAAADLASLHATAADIAAAAALPTFDREQGQLRRDAGMQRVQVATADDITDSLWEVWQRLCREQPIVTSDDLWAAMPGHLAQQVARHPNIIGTLLRLSATKRKWTMDSGQVKRTRRAMGQARRITVWRSLIYQSQPVSR